jgi:hypothetical protein
MGRAAKGQGETERIRARQAAAAFLRAARLTDDAGEREALRRRAADLLAPADEPEAPRAGAVAADERPRAKA